MDAILAKVNFYIINPILGFMFTLAFAYFLFGVFEYFLYYTSDTHREQGGRHILYGLIGIFIMVAFWGIIQILAGTIGVSVSHP